MILTAYLAIVTLYLVMKLSEILENLFLLLQMSLVAPLNQSLCLTCYLTGINLLIVVLPRSSLVSFLVEEINLFFHQKRSVENILERYEPYTYAEKVFVSADPELQDNWCLKYNKLESKY